ncbi:hypothetical protein I7I48_04386 [Histoplasma ohiense]|nr:hypothetical protein I7I48_04386 [Histoplasma ohiense (nom. inval.)]
MNQNHEPKPKPNQKQENKFSNKIGILEVDTQPLQQPLPAAVPVATFRQNCTSPETGAALSTTQDVPGPQKPLSTKVKAINCSVSRQTFNMLERATNPGLFRLWQAG